MSGARDVDGNGMATPTDRRLVEELATYLTDDNVRVREVAVMVGMLTMFVRTNMGPFGAYSIVAETAAEADSVTILFQMTAASVSAHTLQAIGNGDVVGLSFIKDVYMEVVGNQTLLGVEMWRTGDIRDVDDWNARQMRDRAHFKTMVEAGLAKAKVPVQRIVDRADIDKNDANTAVEIARALCGSTKRRCYMELFDPTHDRDTYLLKCWGIDRVSHRFFAALDASKRTMVSRAIVSTFKDQREEYGVVATSFSIQIQIEIRSALGRPPPLPRRPSALPAASAGKKRGRGLLDILSSNWANGPDQKKKRK